MRLTLLILLTILAEGCASSNPEVMNNCISELGNSLGTVIESQDTLRTVAVTTAKGDDPDLSWWFARELESRLIARESFVVVERGDLPKILAEHELVLSDVFDDENRPQVGKLVGADVLVVTEIQPNKKREVYSLRGRAIALESGRILTSASAVLEADDLVFRKTAEESTGGGFFAFVGNVFLGILKIPTTPVTCVLDIFETVCIDERGVGSRTTTAYPARVVKGIWDGIPLPFPWVDGILHNDLYLTEDMWSSWL